MPKVSQMQGVSAHLEVLKNTDGKRRDKRRCAYYEKDTKTCSCPLSPNLYLSVCGGSSKCDYYEEK